MFAWGKWKTTSFTSTTSMKKPQLDLWPTFLGPTHTGLNWLGKLLRDWILKYLAFCRWLLGILYNSFIIIVPYCYVKIYYFRKNLKTPGTRTGSVDKDMEKRKKRNIVTFSYNMLVWIIEALFAVIVSRVHLFVWLCSSMYI